MNFYTIGERVKYVRKNQGIKRRDLAQKIGMSYTALSDFEVGRTKKISNLRQIAEFLGVSQEWLETGKGSSKPIKALEVKPAQDYTRLRLLDICASAGNGLAINNDYPETLQFIDIANHQLQKLLGYLPSGDKVRLITARGDSMQPQINDGDVIMVQIDKPYFQGDGLYVVNINDCLFVKRLQMHPDGLNVISNNPHYPPYLITKERLDSIKICGRALSGICFKNLA